MNLCRVCGTDVELNKKNRRSVSGNPCCKTLLEVAACSLEANFSGAQLDLKRFEEGYVCKGCFREVDRLHRLQKQVVDLKAVVSSKVAQTIHCYRVVACPPVPPALSSSILNEKSPRKRPATVQLESDHQSKRRKHLRTVKLLPSSSNQSPDVAVSVLDIK